MTIRQYAESRGFEIKGKLKLEKDSKGHLYTDEDGNEYYRDERGICIIDKNGAVW